MNFFVIILLWQHILYFVYVVYRAGRQVDLMMIGDMLSKHVGAVKSVLKKVI